MNFYPYFPDLLADFGETLYKRSALKHLAPVNDATNKGIIYVVENCQRQNVISHVEYIFVIYILFFCM
jgi:hypothetical protein